jgi:serine/threonine protein phosphatase PrpC
VQDEDGQPIGPARVWLRDAWQPGLAMSRSIGDTVAASAGVTACPDISVVEITPADAFVIWASDGVWEFIESQDAVDLVAPCADAAEACRLLTKAARHAWAVNEPDVSDDISCVIAIFRSGGGGAAVGSSPPAEAR